MLPSSSLDSSMAVEHAYRRAQAASYASYTGPTNLTWGYVTEDSCPGHGDDTLHMPLPASPQPIFVSTAFPELDGGGQDVPLVDVVFFDFIRPDIVAALNALQTERIYGREDVAVFVDSLTANTVMQEYASREWH